MALVRSLEKQPSEHFRVHGETTAVYKIFEHAGGIYLQINTFGSEFRGDRSHPSQTMQFGPEAIAQLQDILSREVVAAHQPAKRRCFGILSTR
jgi:hypothetical protein